MGMFVLGMLGTFFAWRMPVQADLTTQCAAQIAELTEEVAPTPTLKSNAQKQSQVGNIGARGFSLRVILSLGAMGWGSGQIQKLFVRGRRRVNWRPTTFTPILRSPPANLKWVG